nr:scarecrow-like protein 3 [Ipomoea batatas]
MFQDEGSSSSITSSSPLQALPAGVSVSPGSPYPWLKELKSEERGLYLIHLLLTCAGHVAGGSLENSNVALDQISHLAAPDGDTMQRIACYFAQALADRVLRTLPGVYRALHSTKLASPADEFLARKVFVEMFPFSKVAFLVANQAIIEAMEGEKMVHIIDFHAADPTQWRALLQDLSARPEGPPHLRITGVHPVKEVMEQMGRVLSEEAEKLDIPFQFNAIVSKFESLDLEKLRVKTGEALAISSPMQLHTLLAYDDDKKPSPFASKIPNRRIQITQNSLGDFIEQDVGNDYSPSTDSASSSLSNSPKIEAFLSALWGLSPKLMVVTEQDSNHNGQTIMERLSESLYFYAALFDCLESTLPRSSIERLKVEKALLGEEIKNIIACEGSERKERHEKLEKWFQRFESAGFGNVPFSYYAMLQARRFLQSFGCDGYRIKEENGCVVTCWQDRPLFSVSAWRCRR